MFLPSILVAPCASLVALARASVAFFPLSSDQSEHVVRVSAISHAPISSFLGALGAVQCASCVVRMRVLRPAPTRLGCWSVRLEVEVSGQFRRRRTTRNVNLHPTALLRGATTSPIAPVLVASCA
ncbi:hypothetical protein EXIGLDRAFT_334348 [Exidia glandulosa HHB12029]|uniref:Uncharacterized protein n=1 Tax=Exidia glandulosa HHB12029 TaxID=1314781 RepID=A0A165CP34_EXIGL|nr:hypothetical protein EXIGLDRAFT_334348 [Exidia glandulosa HHB12029]